VSEGCHMKHENWGWGPNHGPSYIGFDPRVNVYANELRVQGDIGYVE